MPASPYQTRSGEVTPPRPPPTAEERLAGFARAMLVPPEQRVENAKKGARVRWGRVHQQRLRRIIRVEDMVRDAYDRAVRLTKDTDPEVRKPLQRELRRLYSGFCELYRLDGHDLPEDMQAYIAGVTDYLAGRVRPPGSE